MALLWGYAHPKSKEMKRKSKTVRLLVNFFNVEA
jgi:hypothetical protein